VKEEGEEERLRAVVALAVGRRDHQHRTVAKEEGQKVVPIHL